MKRYQYLDVARGFGLLLVIISHSCGLSRFLINYYIPLFLWFRDIFIKREEVTKKILNTRQNAF